MKSFFIKILVFMGVLISFYLAMVYALSQGYVDDYYKKFTQPAGSLIIGLSTA
ncbi:MAG: hypothetical protein GW817_11825, partial [Flavobacteriales bacterium]|nr:hypothetical protein [Flavobacteriales bacterium]